MGSETSSVTSELISDFNTLHITSPEKVDMLENKRSAKTYAANESFRDSEFMSRLQEDDLQFSNNQCESNYGTVAFAREPSNKVATDESRSENIPQWKQWFAKKELIDDDTDKRISDRVPEEQLVVSASLSDITGILNTNTFKDHLKSNRSQPSPRKMDTSSFATKVRNNQGSHSDTTKNNTTIDSDPALEAGDIFDNVMKQQRTNFKLESEPRFNKSADLSVENLRILPTNQSSPANDDIYVKSKIPEMSRLDKGNAPIMTEALIPQTNGISLITPDSMGLVFSHETGIWQKPNQTQDLSSSHTADNTTSNNMDSTISSATTKHESIGDKYLKNFKILSDDTQATFENFTEYDTPIESPKLSKPIITGKDKISVGYRYTVLRKDRTNDKIQNEQDSEPLSENAGDEVGSAVNDRNSGKFTMGEVTNLEVGNVTEISQINETAFHQSFQILTSILTDVIHRHTAWEQLHDISLKAKGLTNVYGLGSLLPQIRYCDLSFNELTTIIGIPKYTVHLNCSHNSLSSTFVSFDCLQHLEFLDMSHNSFSHNLQFLSSDFLIHLREVNLSFNNIKSLEGLCHAMPLQTLNVSNNNLRGTIDFQKIINSSTPSSSGFRGRIAEPKFNWQSLERLDLSGNEIEEIKHLEALPNLKVLILDNNPVRFVSCGRASVLEELSVVNDRVRGGLRYTISGSLASLKKLRTSAYVSVPSGLLSLELRNMHAKEINWHALAQLTQLRKLVLHSIRGLDSFSGLPPNLEHLHIAQSMLRRWTSLIQVLPLSRLATLTLEGNQLTRWEPSTNCGASELQWQSKIHNLKQELYNICPVLDRITLDDDHL